jgi:hypothetical protein
MVDREWERTLQHAHGVPRGTLCKMTMFALFCRGVAENEAACDAVVCSGRKNEGLDTRSRQRNAGRRARHERASMLGSMVTRCTLVNHLRLG